MLQYLWLFPDETTVTPQWQPLLQEFYRQAARQTLFFTTNTSQLVDTSQAKFCNHDDDLAELLCRILAENGISTVMVRYI